MESHPPPCLTDFPLHGYWPGQSIICWAHPETAAAGTQAHWRRDKWTDKSCVCNPLLSCVPACAFRPHEWSIVSQWRCRPVSGLAWHNSSCCDRWRCCVVVESSPMPHSTRHVPAIWHPNRENIHCQQRGILETSSKWQWWSCKTQSQH